MLRSTIVTFLVLAVCSGCASREPTIARPFPRPGGWAQTAAKGGNRIPAIAVDITATALSLQGRPYLNGGESPTGFDCSGFTRFVFWTHGILLPRQAADQYRAGTSVRYQELVPGDLVFFETVAPGASHVGVAIGGRKFIHAPNSHGEVRVERLDSSYWDKRYVGARRVVDQEE